LFNILRFLLLITQTYNIYEAVSKDYLTDVLNPSPALPLSDKGRELNYYI